MAERSRATLAVIGVLLVMWVARSQSHGFGSTPTWNREIARIVFDKCASCHRPGGSAFSMVTYLDVQPRANDIKDAVLSRRMPPWGAVKGFGRFRDEGSLSQEQIELVRRWVDGGIRRGNNPAMLPKEPTFTPPPAYQVPAGATPISGTTTLARPLTVDGLIPDKVPAGQSLRITATLPNGSVEPLVWLHGYEDRYRHPFLFRKAIELPAGTLIQGVPPDAVIDLIPR